MPPNGFDISLILFWNNNALEDFFFILNPDSGNSGQVIQILYRWWYQTL